MTKIYSEGFPTAHCLSQVLSLESLGDSRNGSPRERVPLNHIFELDWIPYWKGWGPSVTIVFPFWSHGWIGSGSQNEQETPTVTKETKLPRCEIHKSWWTSQSKSLEKIVMVSGEPQPVVYVSNRYIFVSQAFVLCSFSCGQENRLANTFWS